MKGFFRGIARWIGDHLFLTAVIVLVGLFMLNEERFVKVWDPAVDKATRGADKIEKDTRRLRETGKRLMKEARPDIPGLVLPKREKKDTTHHKPRKGKRGGGIGPSSGSERRGLVALTA